MPGLVAVEDVVEDAGAARLGQELGAEADQRPCRHEVLEPHPAGAVVDHLLQPALAQREQLREDADLVLGRVDREPLDRLVHLAVDDLCHHLRLADRQLESLAAHQLDEDRELELAAALHLPRVRPLGREDAERDVADELLIEPALEIAFSRSLRASLRGTGVEVHTIMPGFVTTPGFPHPKIFTTPLGRPFVVGPERVAKKMFSAIERGKTELIVPWFPYGLGAMAQAVLPGRRPGC